jgi:hypothetical protein
MATVYYFRIRDDRDIDDCWLWAQQYGAWLTASSGHVRYDVVGMDAGVYSTEFGLRFSDYIDYVRAVDW